MKLSTMSLALVWALTLVGCASRAPLASFNGASISQDEVAEYLATKPKVQVSFNGQRLDLPVVDTLEFQAVRELMTQKMLLQMAKEEKLVPTDKEIDSEITVRNQLDPGFITALKQRGLTMSAIRNLILVDLCQFRLQTSGVTLKGDEVDTYIRENPKKLTEPEQFDLAWIIVSTDEKRSKVQKALDSGMDFRSAAREYSEAEGATISGGQYSLHDIGSFPAALRERLMPLKPGDSTEWLKDSSGIMKFQVISRTPEKPLELTPARKEMIRRQLLLQRGNQARDLGKQLSERLRQATPKFANEDLDSLWKNYQQRLKDVSTTRAAASDPIPAKVSP